MDCESEGEDESANDKVGCRRFLCSHGAFLNTNARHLMRLVGASNAKSNGKPLLSCSGDFAIVQSVAWYNFHSSKSTFPPLALSQPAPVNATPPSGPESFSNLYFWRDPLPRVDFPVALSTSDLDALEHYFSWRSYAVGHTFSSTDISLLKEVSSSFSCSSDPKKYPHISRWSRHVVALQKMDHAQMDIKSSAGREILSIIRRRGKVGAQASVSRLSSVCS